MAYVVTHHGAVVAGPFSSVFDADKKKAEMVQADKFLMGELKVEKI